MDSVLPPGATIDRYIIEAVLGQGGMAVVYRVRHAQLGTLHALKFLLVPSPAIRQRLLQEGTVQAMLRHPNIVAVTDVIEHGGAPGLVMEYVRGPSLDQLLRSRRLTLEQVDTIAQGIVSGVGAAHARGIIHRDLKPANVMLAITDQGIVPKVADFGLVKVLGDEGGDAHRTRTGMTMGTPAYMAPEQIRDAKTVDARADLWSLGAILYELVAGQRAFDGEDILDVFVRVAAAKHAPLREVCPDVPERIERAVAAALTVDLGQRVPSCEALLALWNAQEGRGVRAGPWDADLLAAASAMGGGGEESITRPPITPSFFPQAPQQASVPTIHPDDSGTNAAVAVAAPPASVAPQPAPSTSTATIALGFGAVAVILVLLVVAAGSVGFAVTMAMNGEPATVAIAPADPAPPPPAADEPARPAEPPPSDPAPAAPIAAAPVETGSATASVRPAAPARAERAEPAAAGSTDAPRSGGTVVASVVADAPAGVVEPPKPVESAPAVTSDVARVSVASGITERLYLVGADGVPLGPLPTDVPPGKYLIARVSDGQSVPAGARITVSAGQAITLRKGPLGYGP